VVPKAYLVGLRLILSDHPVLTLECIYNKLAKLKIDILPEPDQLRPRILYDTRDVIACFLFIIFSKSVETGILLGDGKLAEVTSIYKKGPKHDRSNYRIDQSV